MSSIMCISTVYTPYALEIQISPNSAKKNIGNFGILLKGPLAGLISRYSARRARRHSVPHRSQSPAHLSPAPHWYQVDYKPQQLSGAQASPVRESVWGNDASLSLAAEPAPLGAAQGLGDGNFESIGTRPSRAARTPSHDLGRCRRAHFGGRRRAPDVSARLRSRRRSHQVA